jgi:hypothetical protein
MALKTTKTTVSLSRAHQLKTELAAQIQMEMDILIQMQHGPWPMEPTHSSMKLLNGQTLMTMATATTKQV